jgi:hypothetical protein
VQLGSDHHGFQLHGVRPAPDATPPSVENTLLQWQEDPGYDDAGFMVLTGSQWGPFEVTLRVLDSDPGPAGSGREDVVEVSVDAVGEIIVSEIVDGPVGSLDGIVGIYRARVAARGRSESAARDYSLDEENDELPLEHYLIELWGAPPQPSAVLRQESAYSRQITDPPQPQIVPEEEPGEAAARAIARDVRGEPGARPLRGDLGSLEVQLTTSQSATKAFNRVQHAFGWPPCNGIISGRDEFATEYYDATLPGPTDGYEIAGHIATTLMEHTKPTKVVKRWNWLFDGEGTIDQLEPLLTTDSVVTIEVEGGPATDEGPQTLVRLVHSGVPIVWIEDLAHLWRWHLAQLANR